MTTVEEKILKAQHDARVAMSEAAKAEANLDYIAMMADIEIPTEEEGGEDESEI